MPMIPIDDYKLHADYHFVSDQVPTILLIHEMAQDSKMWDQLKAHWGASFNVATYDFFGHGRTTDSRRKLTINQLVREASAVVQAFGLKKIHLVGADVGGLIAVFVAKRFPKKIQSLSLLSASFFLPRDTYIPYYRQMVRLLRKDKDLLARHFVETTLHPITAEKADYMIAQLRRVRTETFLQLINLCVKWNQAHDFSLMDEVKTLDMPVLILISEYSSFLPPKGQLIFSLLIPNSKIYIVPGTATQMALDKPVEVAERIASFIDGLRDEPMVPEFMDQNLIQYLDQARDALQTAFAADSAKSSPALGLKVMNGAYQVTWKGEMIHGLWTQRHVRELLLYLAMNHQVASRDQIINDLLPDLPVDRARKHLRVRIAHLNKIFHAHSDASAHHLLQTTRSAVMIGAEIHCDFVDFLNKIRTLQKGEGSTVGRVRQFLSLCEHYHPDCLDDIGSDWISKRMSDAEDALADVMPELFPKLVQNGQRLLALNLLKSGQPFEPYEGYCKEKMEELKNTE